MLSKICIISNNALNKSCSEFSFVQKLSRHICLSPKGQYQQGVPKNEDNKILPELGSGYYGGNIEKTFKNFHKIFLKT